MNPKTSTMTISAPSPYHEALYLIELRPGTGSSESLAKLILSLYNRICGYSYAECIGNLDSRNIDLALRIVTHFTQHGEDEALREVGHTLANKSYKHLWLMGEAMAKACSDWRESQRRTK